MESKTFTKKYNFRLPDRIIELLDEIVKNGKARNRTEALILALDNYSHAEKLGKLIEVTMERNANIIQLAERIEELGYLPKTRQESDDDKENSES